MQAVMQAVLAAVLATLLAAARKRLSRFGFAALAAMFAASLAAAHDDPNSPVFMRLFGTERGAPNAETLVLELRSNSSTALTLTKIVAPGGKKIAIERRREIFGQTAWQPVRFLRLDPGETLTLGAPDYRLLASPETYASLIAYGGGVKATFSPSLEMVALYETPAGPNGMGGAPPGGHAETPGEAAAQTRE